MRALYLTSVWIHILSAMIWIGGMAVVVIAVMPQMRLLEEPHRAAFLRGFIGRLRAVMWTAFSVVAVTGVANLWMRGIRLRDLADVSWHQTPAGRVIGAKLVLFLATAATLFLHERIRHATAVRWLGRLTFGFGLLLVYFAVRLVRGL